MINNKKNKNKKNDKKNKKNKNNRGTDDEGEVPFSTTAKNDLQ